MSWQTYRVLKSKTSSYDLGTCIGRLLYSKCPRGMSLDQYSEGNRTSRRLLLSITVLLALGCITGFLIDQQTDSAPGKRVRAKYRVSTGAANAVEEHVRDSSNAAADGVQLIPKVLHHVYLDGLDSLHEAEESAGPHVGQRFPGYNRTIRRSCRRAHPNWQYKFWNLSQAEELIQGSYPWFLDTFRSYETNVQKGINTARAFTLNGSQLSAISPCWHKVRKD